jgi:hypothetical protein
VLRVGLVVLWDVVHLRQVLEVDGDAWPAIWRQHRGELQLQELIGVPAHLIRPRGGGQIQFLIEEAGTGVIMVENLGVGRIDRLVDVLHRAPEISSGGLIETQHFALHDDDALMPRRPVHPILSNLVVDSYLLRSRELLGDLVLVLCEVALGQTVSRCQCRSLLGRDPIGHDDAGDGGASGDNRGNIERPYQHDLLLGVEKLDILRGRIEGFHFLLGNDFGRLEGGTSRENCGGDGSDDTSRGEQSGRIVLSELGDLLLNFSKQLQLSIYLSRTWMAENIERDQPALGWDRDFRPGLSPIIYRVFPANSAAYSRISPVVLPMDLEFLALLELAAT